MLFQSGLIFNVQVFYCVWVGIQVTLQLNFPGIAEPGMPSDEVY